MSAHSRLVIGEFTSTLVTGGSAPDLKALVWLTFKVTSCGCDVVELTANRLAVVTADLIVELGDARPLLAEAVAGRPCPTIESADSGELHALFDEWVQAYAELTAALASESSR